MKYINKYSSLRNVLVLSMSFLIISSCTNDFAEINTNTNSIGAIGKAELPFLFTKAQDAIAWNGQVQQNLFADQGN